MAHGASILFNGQMILKRVGRAGAGPFPHRIARNHARPDRGTALIGRRGGRLVSVTPFEMQASIAAETPSGRCLHREMRRSRNLGPGGIHILRPRRQMPRGRRCARESRFCAQTNRSGAVDRVPACRAVGLVQVAGRWWRRAVVVLQSPPPARVPPACRGSWPALGGKGPTGRPPWPAPPGAVRCSPGHSAAIQRLRARARAAQGRPVIGFQTPVSAGSTAAQKIARRHDLHDAQPVDAAGVVQPIR